MQNTLIYENKYKFYSKTNNIYKKNKYLQKLQNGGVNNDENKIKKIIIFFEQTFNEYSFERMTEINEESGYTEDDFEKFYKHNIKCIKQLSNNDLTFLDILINKIRNNTIMQCDEDNFVEWDTYVFYFNKDDKLVLMHPQ